MAAPEESMKQSYPLEQKLWWLIFGRFLVALILLLASTAWTRSSAGGPRWDKILPVLALIIFLTATYSLAHRFTKRLLLQARIQFTLDVLLVTGLVWTSDVIHSPYTALYIVIIAASSLFLGPR